MAPIAGTSAVWKCFIRDKLKTSAKCCKCGQNFNNPSTSTLRYHITKTHLIDVPKQPSKKRGGQAVSCTQDTADEDPDNPVIVTSQGGIDEASSSGGRSNDQGSGQGGPSTFAGTGGKSSAKNPELPSVEGPLQKCIFNANAFARGGYRHQQATDALLFMITHDDMPLRSTEKEGLKEYTNALQPNFKMPSEPTITKKMNEKHGTLKDRYGAKFAKVDGLRLTVDIWTDSKSMQSYLGMTAYFRNGTTIESVEIGVRFMPERKTTENLRIAMREICEDWQINYEKVKGVVTDGGDNIKKAVREEFGSDKHISCAALLLNNVCQKALGRKDAPLPSEVLPSQFVEVPEDEDEAAALEEFEEEESTPAVATSPSPHLSTPTEVWPLIMAVKRDVRFFKTSDVASTELREAQIKNGRNPSETLKLVQEVPTRWNSAFYMLDRYLELIDEVTSVKLKLQRDRGSTKRNPPPIVSGDKIQILTEIRDLLKPLEEATKMLCKEKAVTLSNVIPIVFGLKKDTERFLPTHGLVMNMQTVILTEIEKKFNGIELLRPYTAAPLLDHRYKKFVFDNPRAVGLIINHLGNRIAAKVNAAGRELLETQSALAVRNPSLSSGIWAAVDQRLRDTSAGVPIQEPSSGLHPQLKAYLCEPVVERSSNPNPLQTWQKMRPVMEYVHELAMEYLPIIATSVASERLFSHAGLVSTQRRNRLSPKHLNVLVFLRSVPKDVWFDCK